MMICLFDRVENAVKKGQNAGYRHFLLCPLSFLQSPVGLLKVGMCGKELARSKLKAFVDECINLYQPITR